MASLALLAGLIIAARRWHRPGASPTTVRAAAAATPAAPRTPAPGRVDAPAPSLQAIAAFDRWLAGSSARQVSEGVALARARRAELKRLIVSDPAAALHHAVSRAARASLPAAVAAQLETPIDAFGSYEVVSVCSEQAPHIDRWTTISGKTYLTHTSGRRLATLSKNRLAVHGIALDDELALSDLPYRPLEVAEQPAGTANTTTVAVGDTTRQFSSSTELDAWAASTAAAEITANPNALSSPPAVADVNSWTMGPKTVLWIRAEFPDDPGSPAADADINTAMAAADVFYQDVSHGTTSLQTTILPDTVKLTTLKSTYEASSSSYLTLRSDAVQLARAYDAANGGSGKYNPDNYDRYIVVFKHVTAYVWSGSAAVGNKGLVLNGTSAGAVAAHELGHNDGLHHSHAWAPSAGSAIGAGTHLEYGDAFDDMGSGQFGNISGHFNAVQKFNLGYLTASSIQTVSQSGRYRIYRHDDRNASGIQALKLPSSWAGTAYWLEYRHAAPYPQFIFPPVGTGQLPRLIDGVVVHWDQGPSFTPGVGTYLLDMTPTNTNGPAPSSDTALTHLLDDAALALGESFTDPTAGFTVTPVAVGGAAPNEWIDVYISLGAVSGNHAPVVASSAPTGLLDTHADAGFTATATDADNDPIYYHWDFGDGTIAPTSAAVNHHWLKAGTYTVTCTALDGRGGSSSTSYPVTVHDALATWQARAPALTSHYFYDVLFDGAKFVAVGSYVAAVSTDGINWSLGSGMTSQNYNLAVAYGGGRYVAVGKLPSSPTAGASITTSTDGITWTDHSVSSGTAELMSVAYGAGRFVAVGDAGSVIESADGTSWSNVGPGTTNNLTSVRFAAGRFVAVGANGTFLTSTDGIHWQDCTAPNETSTSWNVVYYQGVWYALTSNYPVADSTKRVAWASVDAINWSRVYFNVPTSLDGMVSVGGGNLLLGISRINDGRIYVSESPALGWNDESVFPAANATSTTGLAAAAEGNGTVVVVGLSGAIFTPTGRPSLIRVPGNQTSTAGDVAVLSVTAYATGPFTYQWQKNGVNIPGATNATLAIANASSGDAAAYRAAVANTTGTILTAPVQLSVVSAGPVINPSRLTNLSIRSQAGSGDQSLIVGVAIGGGAANATKPLLVRAVGPTLAAFGVAGAIPDPVLSIYPFGAAQPVATNDGWRGDVPIAAVAQSVNAFGLSATSADAAVYRQFAAAGYTMQVTSNAANGVALVEVYDATGSNGFTASTPRLTNVSARTQVGTDAGVLIAGFSIGGTGTKRLLIRAVGPTLASFGVGGTLADPKLELYRQDTGAKVMENDNWNNDPDVVSAATAKGAFPLQAGSKDAALVIELQPGAYSAIIRGVNNTTGVALVELYDLQ